MPFQSVEFLFFFLPGTWFSWRAFARISERAAIAVLIAASLISYACYEPRCVATLLALGALTYLLGFSCQKKDRLSLALILSCNLGALVWFKYLSPAQVFPLGVSFFVLQKIAFAVDLYRGEATMDRADRFALFVVFFAQLLAGPIARFQEVSPQLRLERMRAQADLGRGLFLLAVGLGMKLFLADPLIPLVAQGFDDLETASGWDCWIAAAAYTLQIYFDFSGYATMAVGLGIVFGIALPWNFESPLKASSLVDFWRRWHITLSEFLRDYLYYPLGGGRKGRARRFANLLFVMAICGLWHGGSAHFLLWGVLHGLGLVVNHAWRASGRTLPRGGGRALTLLFVVLCFVAFRAPSVTQAWLFWQRMGTGSFALSSLASYLSVRSGAALAAAGIALWAPGSRQLSDRFCANRWQTMATGALLFLGTLRVIFSGGTYEFIYFRF